MTEIEISSVREMIGVKKDFSRKVEDSLKIKFYCLKIKMRTGRALLLWLAGRTVQNPSLKETTSHGKTNILAIIINLLF